MFILFIDILDNYYHYPVILSILSMAVRCESFDQKEYLEEALEKGASKEIDASQDPDKEQALNYNGLFTNDPRIPLSEYHKGQCSKTFNLFMNQLEGYIHDNDPFFRHKVYLPVYQRRKNMAYKTQERLNDRQHNASSTYIRTTRDLLLHYHVTGERLGGPSEMRTVMRFNDLKPRLYYSTGGDQYFGAEFIRDIVYDILNFLPSTNAATRYNVHRLTDLRLLEIGEFLITYDYTSFTTALAELKYFLFQLGEYFKGHTIKVLDVFQGITSLDLGVYIQQYNERVNINAPYDVSRIHVGVFDLLYQHKSGMLGTQGNIGFSMLLHGISISCACGDPNNCTCVGDDGLVRLGSRKSSAFDVDYRQSELNRINNAVALLGDLPPEKVETWEQQHEDEELDGKGWQFLKRPLNLDGMGGLSFGKLLEFPNMSLAYPYTDGIHPSPEPLIARAKSFCSQTARFFDRCRLDFDDEISHTDATLSLHILRRCYAALHLNPAGSLPGIYHKASGLCTNFFVPPLVLECYTENWASILLRERTSTFSYTAYSEYSRPGGMSSYGDTFVCTPHGIQRLAEDMGYLESEYVMMDYDPNHSEENILNILKGYLRPLIKYTVIKPLPQWYNDYMYGTDYRSNVSHEEYIHPEDIHITYDGSDTDTSDVDSIDEDL